MCEAAPLKDSLKAREAAMLESEQLAYKERERAARVKQSAQQTQDEMAKYEWDLVKKTM